MMNHAETPKIRVRDFAKANHVENNNSINVAAVNQIGDNPLQNAETISLSSDDEVPEIKFSKRKQPKTPASTKPKASRLTRTPAFRSRLSKTPVDPSKYHKISEYFSSAKKDYKVEPATPIKEQDDKEQQPKRTEAQQLISEMRQVKVVLRRLSIEKKVETVKKRKVQEDQSKLPEFMSYEPSNGDNYFTTYEKSTLPEGQFPMVRIENADLLSNGNRILLANGSSKESMEVAKVDSSSGQLTTLKTETTSNVSLCDGVGDSSNSCFQNIENEPSNSISNDDLPESEAAYNLRSKNSKAIEKPKKSSKQSKAKKPTNKRKKTICPSYKIVDGTKLAVDAFRYGDIEDVEHYFLSHFHADHYIGLKKSFNHKLYVSEITGRLVKEFVKVDEKYMTCLQIGTPIIVDNVEVIALDANHCPGAVMFLFKLPTGKCILHTGDFRASPEMEEYPEFWNNEIDTIYLDTTYLSNKYDFFTQSDSIASVLEGCREFRKKAAGASSQCLYLCGAYKIGKEKVWLRIAQEFNLKVWVDDERRKALNCINNEEINKVLTRAAENASIHVLPLGNLSYQFVSQYVAQFGELYSKVLAIRPSGWEKNSKMPTFNSRISIYGVQYSEHSSYNELERFIRFLQPKKVISTVPYSNKNVEKTPNIPASWYNHSLKPKTQSHQRKIKEFMTKNSKGAKAVKAETKSKSAQKSEQIVNIEPITIDDSDDDFMP